MASRKSLSLLFREKTFRVDDIAENDLGKNTQYQCVSFYPPVYLPSYCVVIDSAKWNDIEKAKNGEKRKGYYEIYHGWCRERSKKYNKKTEKVYGEPEKILKNAECVFIKHHTPRWAREKIYRNFKPYEGMVKSKNKQFGIYEKRK